MQVLISGNFKIEKEGDFYYVRDQKGYDLMDVGFEDVEIE